MPQPDNTNQDEKKTNDAKSPSSARSNVGALLIFTCIIIAIAGFSLLYLSTNRTDEWNKVWFPIIVNALLLLVVVVQAFIYFRQWEAMREQLNEMRDQTTAMQVQAEASRASANAAELSAKAAHESALLMAQSERPDITVTVKMDDLTVGEPIRMVFDIYNAGNTTAYNFGIHVSCDWKDAPFDGILDYGEPKPEAAEPIRPRTHKYVHPHSWFYRLTIHDIASINFGKRIFFIYGIIWYEDGAGRKYSEPFCRRYLKESPNDPVECPGSIREKMQEQPAEADNKQENPNQD